MRCSDPKVGPLGGEGKIIESDETFVGGKQKIVHKGKPEPRKHAVHALVERGRMRAKHVADVTGETLRQNLREMADRKSELHTDEALHRMGGKEFAKHRTVNHAKDEDFKDGAGVQSAEAFFAIFSAASPDDSTASASSICSVTSSNSSFAGTTDPSSASRISSAPPSCSSAPAASDPPIGLLTKEPNPTKLTRELRIANLQWKRKGR